MCLAILRLRWWTITASLVILPSLWSAPLLAGDPASLAKAAEAGDRAAVLKQLRDETEVDAPQPDGMTALHWAVYHDDAELTQALLTAGADPERQSRYGIAPLAIASQNGNSEIVETLLAAGADPNASRRGGETVLMTAARTGRLSPVRTLVDAGADIESTDRKGQNALMWAAAEGHRDVVDFLISRGADWQRPLDSGFSAFWFAIREGETEVVFRLLEAGADVNAVAKPKKSSNKGLRRGMTPMLLAVENGHFELAANLLDAGADPNADDAGYTALHALTWVRKPLRGDGDPPPVGSGRLSSLDCVRHLIDHGADVNARHGRAGAPNGRLNKTDATPFLLAAETGDLPLLKLLLAYGADPALANADQCTPLLAAAGVGVLSNGDESAGTEEEAIATVAFLLEHGADINALDAHGKSAMHGAAYKSWSKLVHFLSSRGADAAVWHRKNGRGWTPRMIAQGHRPGNFRPSVETTQAVEAAMKAAGLAPDAPPVP